MTAPIRTPTCAELAVLFCAAALCSCAGAPPITPAVSAARPVAAPPMVTMAPIANPEEAAPRRDGSRPRRSEPSSTPSRRAPVKSAPAAAAPPPPPPAPTAPSRDPARAAQLRARGLEQLNRGSSAQAVALLAQASRLDPENVLIRRDLERAERINRAVGGGH